MVSRREFLAGAAAVTAGQAWAAPPEASLRPFLRPDGFELRGIPSLERLALEADLGGRVSALAADARTGEVLEVYNPVLPMPPASTAKAMTTLYALDKLGAGHRFRTQLLGHGEIANGRLQGDLWLVGSGDPTLDTDKINDMARALRATGLREVTGRLKVVATALPFIHEIDPSQPEHVGYNPAISGLNLNYNRVHFEWLREAGGYTIRMDARSETIRPAVTRQRMRIADRQAPIYTYDAAEGREDWTVARAALGDNGSRWLPVRDPAFYVAEVFQVLARSHGIVLDGPDIAALAPSDALPLVEQTSPPLDEILQSMLRWSTNLTAETVGLSASIAAGGRPESLPQSAGLMSEWMQQRLGARRPAFVDHSGLGPDSRITAADMVQCLIAAGPQGALRGLMRSHAMRDENGATMADHPVEVSAKTGTLNFVSTLAGYAQAPSGRLIAFAVFCADLPRREALTLAEAERPRGGRSYSRCARRLQQAMIERWAAVYG